MSTYEDAWSQLNAEPAVAPQTNKEAAYNVLNQHADKLSLSPEEQYSMGWGADALSDAQIANHAKALTDQINAAQSTQILRNSVKRSNSSATNAQAEAVPAATPSQGGSQGGGGHATDVTDASSGSGYSPTAANGGLGIGDLSDSLKADALSTFKSTLPLGVIPATLAGLVKMGYSQSQALAKINATDDPLGSLIAAQGWSLKTDTPDASAQATDSAAGGVGTAATQAAGGLQSQAALGQSPDSLSDSDRAALGDAMAGWGSWGGGSRGTGERNTPSNDGGISQSRGTTNDANGGDASA